MKKVLFMSVTAILLLGACTMNGDDNDARQGDDRTGVEQTRYNDLNQDNRGVGNERRMTNENQGDNRNTADRNRNTDQYDVSQEAADAITSEIPEVHGAYVITMGNNAYVAAMFDDDQRDRDGLNQRNTGTDNQGNENRGQADDDGRNDNRNTGNNDRVFDDQMDESGQLTDDLKERIGTIVREQDDTITNVYVTTNPEFSNLTRDYMNDIDEGRPVRGFFDQIGSMIERVFPQNQR